MSRVAAFLRPSWVWAGVMLGSVAVACSSPTSSTSFESAGTGLLDCDEGAGCKQSLREASECREESDAHAVTLQRILPDLETLAVYLVRAEETEGPGSPQAETLRQRIAADEEELRAAIARVRDCRQFVNASFGPSPYGPSVHSKDIANDLCSTGHSKFAGVSVLTNSKDPARGRSGHLAYGTATWVDGHAAECWEVSCFLSPDGGRANETYLYCHRESDFYDVALRFSGAEWELARKTKELRP